MKFFPLLIVVPLLFASCEITDMPLRDGVESIDLEKGSIAIFSIHATKTYKPKHQARLGSIKVTGEAGKTTFQGAWGELQKSGYLGDTIESFQSVQLEPGSYTLQSIGGGSQHFKPPGNFTCPVDATFELQPNEVVYIGRIDMRCRKRESGEARAGGLFPVIDQIYLGFRGGTWDVAIQDQFYGDLAEYRRTYPFLEDVEIGKRLMKLPDESE